MGTDYLSRQASVEAALAAATAAVDHVARHRSAAELQQARQVIGGLWNQLEGRINPVATFATLKSLIEWAKKEPPEIASAISSVKDANDAILAHELRSDPHNVTIRAIEHARSAGVDRDEVAQLMKAARRA